MTKFFVILTLVVCLPAFAFSQTRTSRKPIPSVVPIKPTVDPGVVSGRTYSNAQFSFAVTFPDTWLIPDSDYEEYMKKHGIDVSLKVPAANDPIAQRKLNESAKNVTLLLTAFRSMPGTPANATARISAEDLTKLPQVKDAVDYVDLMVETLGLVKHPPNFKYSDTQAEQLGKKQFAYLDTASGNEKTRLYATVKDRFAILFVITYTSDNDLQTFRRVLEQGDFESK